ncbi:Thermonuclease precursor [Variovorax sp. SRS16]|uniref:thermonuclease family protein n=1 Tax=Variovorax sp. SRS16 TaxID=282217 RepID=UPI0013168F83|nr:thermonuclease family protein [Variovorax sp. SRS16]VTU18659.1 Thermonuclease precursor [Variovorax sp. SRS16]
MVAFAGRRQQQRPRRPVIPALHRGAHPSVPRALAAILLALAALHAQAERIDGRVVTVADGDTIVVLDALKVQHRIRLGAIDAPEWSQPFGRRSRASLAQLIAGKTVQVQVDRLDRYGRSVGVVRLGEIDVNRMQIERGMAWWYRQYAGEQRIPDRLAYERAERDAHRARRGLWSDAQPVPPWTWRARHR